MADYTNGKIYKVVCGETNRIYIGSTINLLKYRLSKHKVLNNSCRCNDFINPTIHLLEDYSCNNRKELELRERYYIENTDCVNIKIPSRTKKEWYLDNAEKYKQYYIDNAEKLKEKINCECGGRYTHANKQSHLKTNKHKKYLENNI